MSRVAVSPGHRKRDPAFLSLRIASRTIAGALCLGIGLWGGPTRALLSARVGYAVCSGQLAGIPTTVDALVGFSGLSWDVSAKIEGLPFSGVSISHSFAQPWTGFRADFYPWRDWRLELGAMAEGFGVDGGVW